MEDKISDDFKANKQSYTLFIIAGIAALIVILSIYFLSGKQASSQKPIPAVQIIPIENPALYSDSYAEAQENYKKVQDLLNTAQADLKKLTDELAQNKEAIWWYINQRDANKAANSKNAMTFLEKTRKDSKALEPAVLKIVDQLHKDITALPPSVSKRKALDKMNAGKPRLTAALETEKAANLAFCASKEKVLTALYNSKAPIFQPRADDSAKPDYNDPDKYNAWVAKHNAEVEERNQAARDYGKVIDRDAKESEKYGDSKLYDTFERFYGDWVLMDIPDNSQQENKFTNSLSKVDPAYLLKNPEKR